MCTALAYKGRNLLYGFNLDIDPECWHYDVYKTKNYFTVGITVGHTVYFTHGVNRNGAFGNLPYMNGDPFTPPKGVRQERIDLMVDRYIRGRYTYEDIAEILRTKTLVPVPAATMHSLIGSGAGKMLIAEPGLGFRSIEENHAVLTNFPLLAGLTDFSNPFYGKDRFDRAEEELSAAGEEYSAEDMMRLLQAVKQEGKWGTKVSFVYSRNENAVRYCLNGDFSQIMFHRF